jgi:hypothetical protein
MDNNRSDNVQPRPQVSKLHYLVFWGMGLLVYLVVIWRMFTHPAALQLLADVDSCWYLGMAGNLSKGQFWDVQQQAPFMPLYALLMVPMFWVKQIEFGTLFAFTVTWLGFLIWLYRLVGPRWIVLVPFLTLPILNNYLLAWSEVLSLPLIMLLFVNLARSGQATFEWPVDGQNQKSIEPAGDKTTSLLLVLLVLTRWANLYFGGAVCLIWALEAARNQNWFNIKVMKRLAVLIGPSFLVVVSVGMLTFYHTGYLLGYDKTGPEVSVSASSAQDWMVAISQLVSWFRDPVVGSLGLRVGLWIAQAILLLWLIKRKDLAWIRGRSARLMGLAIGYTLWIWITERVTELDVVDYRLLAPCLLITWMAFVNLELRNKDKMQT